MNSRFEKQKEFIDDAGDLLAHILNTIALTSEKTLAAGVLMLSTIPEYVGIAAATGNHYVAIVAALVSVVVVKLALRDMSLTIPLMGKAKITVSFWTLYLSQILAGVGFIIASGSYIDIGFIVISLVGAVCSESIAVLIKHEAAKLLEQNYETEKMGIRLREQREKSEARIRAYNAKHAVDGAQTPPIEEPAEPALTTAQVRKGQEKGRSTRSAKVQQRRDDLLRRLIESYPGVDLKEISYTSMATLINVSDDTAKRDIQALQAEKRINGKVPEEL